MTMLPPPVAPTPLAPAPPISSVPPPPPGAYPAPSVPGGSPRRSFWQHPVSITAVVVAAVVGSAGVIARATSLPTAAPLAVEEYLPHDGAFDAYDLRTSNGETTLLIESQRVRGFGGLSGLPLFQATMGMTALDLDADSLGSANLWRTTTRQVSEVGVTSQAIALAVVADDGVRAVLDYGGTYPAVFDPPMLLLPNDLSVGSSWNESGDAYPEGLLSYTTEGRVVDVDAERCVTVESSRVLTFDDGSELSRSEATERWCPGLGMVSGTTSNTSGGVPTVFEYERLEGGPVGTAEHLARYERPAPGPAIERVDAVAWSATETPLAHRDQFMGQQAISSIIGVPPEQSSDGLVVLALASAGDVVAFRSQDPLPDSPDTTPSLVEQWRAHPGGEVISVVVLGDLVVTTTSLRRIVAYDLDGVRRWEVELDDLVLGRPTRAADVVVVHGLDGRVTAIDVDTGRIVWRATTPADADVAPVAVGDLVVAADRGGSVFALDAATGRRSWSLQSSRVTSMAAIGELLVTIDEAGEMTARGPDGSERWRRTYDAWGGRVVAVGDLVGVVGDELVTVFDPLDGAQRWSATYTVDAAVSGDRVFLLDDTELCVLGASGEQEGCAEVPELPFGDARYLLADPAGAWLVDSTTVVHRVGLPRAVGG